MRKAALRAAVEGRTAAPIRYVEDFDEDGPLILKHACDMHLEGVVSKLRDAPYSLRPVGEFRQEQMP